MDNLPDIFKLGLRPGGRHEFSRQDVHFMPFFPLDPRNEYMHTQQCNKLRIWKNKAMTSLIMLSIQPQVLWEKEVRICLANGFLLTTSTIPASYIESIYELEFLEESGQWKHHLIYHQLAARVNWHGCKNGQPARSCTIVDAICHDSSQRCSMIRECERNATFRHNCHPACLKAVPKQSVQCLQCWGHLLTEDGIAEIKDTKAVEKEDMKLKGISPERRTSHDVEFQINGESIQFPRIDVRRFCTRFKIATSGRIGTRSREDDPDRPQGTVERISSIEPLIWNKHHRKVYGYEFTEDPRAVTCDANFAKIEMFLQHRSVVSVVFGRILLASNLGVEG